MYGYIYMIINKVNEKTYIGQRKFNGEWYEDKYMGSGKKLASAKKHYGIENFEKFLVQYCNSKDELDKQEIFWISEYRKRGKAEYNIADGGDGGCVLGFAPNKGKKFSEETKRKISEKTRGKKRSEETKRKISEAKKGKNNPMFGKTHSEEVCKKLSESHKGKHPSEETRRKLSESHKGKPHPISEETKKKISEKMKGNKNALRK